MVVSAFALLYTIKAIIGMAGKVANSLNTINHQPDASCNYRIQISSLNASYCLAHKLKKLQLRGEDPYLIRTISVYSLVKPFAIIPESPFSAKKTFRNSSETTMPQTLDMPCSAPYGDRR
jgi:hypothetical protein